MGNRSAVYPGTFDPITFGHLDVIIRGAKLFDSLTVAVAVNIDKKPLFSIDERKAMIQEAVQERGIENVRIESFEGIIVDFVERIGGRVLLRGIRTLSDWESEFQMALANRELNAEIETVFIMTSHEFSFISSRLIREVAALGGDISKFVPASAERRLRDVVDNSTSSG